MEAEKAPAILAHFGCNVEEYTWMHSASFLSAALKDPEYEIEEISVHETQCMDNSWSMNFLSSVKCRM